MSTVDDADQDVEPTESPTEQVLETNGRDALSPIHELADDLGAAARVRDWIVTDQSRDAVDEVPTTDDVLDVFEQADADLTLVFEHDQGFGYVSKPEQWLRYSVITDDEQVAGIAQIERRDRDDVKYTRSSVAEWKVRDWIRLAIETSRLEIASGADLAVFDDTDRFEGAR